MWFNLVSSVALLSPTLSELMYCSTPSFHVHRQLWSLLKLMFIESVMPSNHLILCHPFSSCLQFSQYQGLFHRISLCIRWLKNWRFSFSVSPFSEYSGLIFFRIDRFDLLTVQGIPKSFL